jgi:hypothetical protein
VPTPTKQHKKMEKMLSKMEKTNKQLLAKLKAAEEKNSKKKPKTPTKTKPSKKPTKTKPSKKKTPVVESDEEEVAESVTQLVPDTDTESASETSAAAVEDLAEKVRQLQDAINEGHEPVLLNVIARQDRQLLNQFTIPNLKNMASTIRCGVPSKISKKAEVIDYVLSIDVQAAGGRKRTRSTQEL